MGRRPVAGVDARALGTAGIGRYLSVILARLLTDERFGAVVLLGEPESLSALAESHGARDRVVIRPAGGTLYSPGTQLRWAAKRALGRLSADVWFFPHYDVPLFAFPQRSVVTVQDLTHFRVPELFPAWKRAAGSVLLDHAARQATRVLVSSAATRNDLVERMPDAEEKVSVIPFGVSSALHACNGDTDACRASSQALQPYLLCVGNRKPHKNLRVAVDVLALLRPDWPELQLVLAGRHFSEGDGVRRRAEALGVGGAVVELSGVSDPELRCLYSHAEALLFPSLYEGFGLPILEAMACGTPVVASDRASIPEVMADAGLLADATDANGFAEAVRSLRRQTGLRDELVRRGHARAAALSWDRTVASTLDVLLATAESVSR